MPWSKMRIWVASRMPKITPLMVTVSSRCNCRISASASGVFSSTCAIGVGHLSVGCDRGVRTLAAPALDIHRHRILADVGVRPLYVHRQRRGFAAEALRPDAGLINRLQQ